MCLDTLLIQKFGNSAIGHTRVMQRLDVVMQFFLSRRVSITAAGSKSVSAVRNLKTEIMGVLNFAKSAFGFIQQSPSVFER